MTNERELYKNISGYMARTFDKKCESSRYNLETMNGILGRLMDSSTIYASRECGYGQRYAETLDYIKRFMVAIGRALKNPDISDEMVETMLTVHRFKRSHEKNGKQYIIDHHTFFYTPDDINALYDSYLKCKDVRKAVRIMENKWVQSYDGGIGIHKGEIETQWLDRFSHKVRFGMPVTGKEEAIEKTDHEHENVYGNVELDYA